MTNPRSVSRVTDRPTALESGVHRQRRSRLPGFYKLPVAERRAALTEEGWLTSEGARELARQCGFDESVANNMSENVVGIHGLPLALGLNFKVNGRELLAPMAVEEPSVVAAASNAARIVHEAGGFYAEADEPLMIAQVQLLEVPDVERAQRAVADEREELLARANAVIPEMARRGGGVRAIEVRVLEETATKGAMLAVHLVVDVRDAMGANLLNTLAEAMAHPLRALTGGRVGLKILSNLSDRRCVRVSARIPAAKLAHAGFTGDEVRDGIAAASRFAELDPYRACTHNKGVMNGVDAVVLATGNDWRAVEAGAHAFAARSGRYKPFAVWHATDDGALLGALELPLALGVVGGASRAHAGVRLALALADVDSAAELAMLAGAVGLASNFAALRALATEGIQKGHMALHARTVALSAGAVGDEVEPLARSLSEEHDYRLSRAQALLLAMRAPASNDADDANDNE